MSPFLTFAICLSIAYLLYYGANIGKDLYATVKKLTSNELVFEFEDVPNKKAVSLFIHRDGGFNRNIFNLKHFLVGSKLLSGSV